MIEFLNSIGIDGDFIKANDGSLILDIKDSREHAKIYSKLDNCPDLDIDDAASQINTESSVIQFYNSEYTITLLADLEGDTYRLTIREN